MKIFVNKPTEIIRLKIQSKGNKPKYISFIDCGLLDCSVDIYSLLIEYLDKNVKPSEILSQKRVSLTFYNVITKETISESIIGIPVDLIIEIINNKYLKKDE